MEIIEPEIYGVEFATGKKIEITLLPIEDIEMLYIEYNKAMKEPETC
jgi:hypothetical protein